MSEPTELEVTLLNLEGALDDASSHVGDIDHYRNEAANAISNAADFVGDIQEAINNPSPWTPGCCIVAWGDLSDAFTFVGPYPDNHAAQNAKPSPNASWTVIPLVSPSDIT